jgi:hypothetical protein
MSVLRAPAPARAIAHQVTAERDGQRFERRGGPVQPLADVDARFDPHRELDLVPK